MPPLPHVQGSTTSADAAAAAAPRARPDRLRVLEAIRAAGTVGRTDQELQDQLHLIESTERPRRRGLVKAGLVADSGLTRPTRSSCEATVWVDARLLERQPALPGVG